MRLKYCIALLSVVFNPLAVSQDSSHSLAYQLIEKENHQIHLLEVDPQAFKIMLVSAQDEEQGRKGVSSFVEQHKALAGVNAGYFYITNSGKGKPAGALKINHQWFGYQRFGRGAIGWNDEGVLVDRIQTKKSNQGNKPTVDVLPQLDTSPLSRKCWQDFAYIVGGIPVLIQHGKVVSDYQTEKAKKSFLEERHARTAVCIKENHHWLFLVAAHTKEPDRPFVFNIVEGLTIAELAQFLHGQGCFDAINLDGGGSSTLVMKDKILNTPAGDMDEFLHMYHERPVSDAIVVLPR